MKNWKIEAIIIAFGLLLIGEGIRTGLGRVSPNTRTVTVKGLAEREVPANKVIWPLVYKFLENDMSNIYERTNSMNKTIIAFLKENGIADTEITVNAPEIIDLNAERYSENRTGYRYNVTSVITVASNKVELVRELINRQGDLLKKGIAPVSGDYRYNVVYEYTDLNSIKPEMIKEATKNARAAAEQFAEDSDSELGKIKKASQGQFSISDRDSNTPYIKNIRVVTTVDYFLED